MGIKDLTQSEATALEGTRHPVSRVLYPAEGLSPYYTWLRATLKQLGDAAAGWLRVHESDESDTHVYVAPGRAIIDGVVLTWDGADIDLSAHTSDVAYVWLYNDGGSGAIDFGADGDGWPDSGTTPHIKLAEVTLDGDGVDSILDRRNETMLRLDHVAAVDDLDQTISDPPTQGEVQAISDKMDELLGALRDAGVMLSG